MHVDGTDSELLEPNWNRCGRAASGWFVQGGFCVRSQPEIRWVTLLEGYLFLGTGVASFEAELIGALCLVQGLLHIFSADAHCACAASWYQKFLTTKN